MTRIEPHGAPLTPSAAADLERAPRAVVQFGHAPDGMPWFVDVDRSSRLESLFRTVLQIFELGDRSELPARVRRAYRDPGGRAA